MPSNRRTGLVLIGLAFTIAALIGLWLATRVVSRESSGILLPAGTAFIVVLLVATVGIYFYVQEADAPSTIDESLVLKQRDLVDLLREHHQLRIDDAAFTLDVSTDDVYEMVDQLIELDVFPGRIDREQGVLYLVPPNV